MFLRLTAPVALVEIATSAFDATGGTVDVDVGTVGGEWQWGCGLGDAGFGRNGTRPVLESRSGDGATTAGVFPLGAVTAWDDPGATHDEAAIFLHQRSRMSTDAGKPTSGCLSPGYEDLADTRRAIDPGLNPHFAIGPRDWLVGTA